MNEQLNRSGETAVVGRLGAMPLVSIGMPVRNGGAFLREALASVIAQDYPNLEIIISDNCSTDETVDIVKEFQRRDSRIRLLRQDNRLRAFDNFLCVLDASRGAFFAWAAHDDTRSTNFVSTLLRAFDEKDTVLAFGDLFVRRGIGAEIRRKSFDFDNCALAPIGRMRRQAFMQCYHLYGLWRAEFLKSLHWAFSPWWGDLALLVTAAGLAKFKYVPGAEFIYLEHHKTAAQRAATESFAAPSSRALNELKLLKATCVTSFRNLPLHLAAAAFLVVLERGIRGLSAWVWRRIPFVGSRERSIA